MNKLRIVLDSNIIFSALLSSDNKFKYLIYDNRFKFFSCNFLFTEIFKNKEKLLNISKLSEKDLLIQMSNIFSRIHFIPEEFIPKEIYKKAYDLCKNIDESDTPFIALTIFLNAKLLTGDMKLANKLKTLTISVTEILNNKLK